MNDVLTESHSGLTLTEAPAVGSRQKRIDAIKESIKNVPVENDIYTVKNVKSFRGMEGYGFNASLYRNGKRIGLVIDSAQGAEYDYELDSERDYWLLDKYARGVHVSRNINTEENPIMSDYYGPDYFISQLVTAFEVVAEEKKMCRGKVVVKTKECKEHEWVLYKCAYTEANVAKIKSFYPDETISILNEKYQKVSK